MGRKRTYRQLRSVNIIVLLVLSTILLLLSLVHIRELDQIVVLNDEFGYWSVAASIAGKNWKDLILNTPYYSYGYSILLVPLFYLKLPTYLIYKLAILFNAFILVLGYWISILCGQKIFPKMNRKLLMAVCFLITCYPNVLVQTQIAWTESLLNFLFWVTILIILSILETPRTWKMLVFSIVLGYMLIVHQRTVGIVLSGGIIIILLCISKKVPFKDMILGLSVLCGIVIISFWLKGNLKDWLWTSSELKNMNDFSGQTSLINAVFSKSGLQSIFYGLAGRIFYFLVSGGIIWYCGFVQIFKNIFFVIKKSTIRVIDYIPHVEAFIALSFLTSLAIGLTSVAQGFARADTVVYGRYIENTMGPILLIGAGLIIQKKIPIKQIVSYFLMLTITSFLTIHILQLIGNSSFVDISSVGLAKFFEGQNGKEAIVHATLCTFILSGIVCTLVYSRWKHIGYLVAGVVILGYWLSIGQYVYIHTIAYMQTTKTENNENIAELLKKTEKNTIYYFKDKRFDPYCSNVKYLQFWVPDIQVKVISQEDEKEVPPNSIWICEKGNKNVENQIRDAKILIESNELYICTQMDSKLTSILKKKGYSFECPVDLSMAESEIWDSNYQGLRSTGEAGKLIENYEMSLNAGTYNVNFNIKTLDTAGRDILGKCLLTKHEGKEVLKELVIDKDFFRENNSQIKFSCMDTKDIEITVEVEKNVILQVSSITYEKVNNTYLVGSDCKRDICEILDKINKLRPAQVNYTSAHKNMEYNFSYVERLYPDLSFNYMDVEKLKKKTNEEDEYIILEKNNVDIFDYLDKYDCLKVNATYILLAQKGNDVASSWIENGQEICSKDNFINADVLRLNTDGTVYSDNTISLNQGTYEIKFSSSNLEGNIELHAGKVKEKINFNSEPKEEITTVSIKSDNQPMYWKVNSMGEQAPAVNIRRIDDSYHIDLSEEEKTVLRAGDKILIPLFEDLGMGTYEFIFTVKNSSERFSNVEVKLYRTVDSENRILMDMEEHNEKNIKRATRQIEQLYEVERNGFQGIKCVIQNKGEKPMELKTIQFKIVN